MAAEAVVTMNTVAVDSLMDRHLDGGTDITRGEWVCFRYVYLPPPGPDEAAGYGDRAELAPHPIAPGLVLLSPRRSTAGLGQ